MDYEKAYKDALERAKQFSEHPLQEDSANIVEYIFPELAESEDERIRKEIIEFVKNNVLAVDERHSRWLAWLEKQGKQKPIDKVEPKFEIEKGKWYVCNTSRYTDFIVGKAYYCPKNGMLRPNENEMARYVARDCFHPWSIADAKEGDVLAGGDWLFIFREFHINGFPKCHCHYDLTLENFKVDTDSYMAGGGDIYPATKEQCDLLFEKMHEAGYMWDTESKQILSLKAEPTMEIRGNEGKISPKVDCFDTELNALLKKYEHLPKKELQEPLEFYLGVVRDDLDIVREEKPKWSEEEIKEAQLDYWRSVGGKEWHGVPVQETIAWLEKQGGQKWTDEDEIGSDATIELLEYFINYAPEFRKPTIRRSIDWLKSIKKRMEEQQ